MKTAHSVSCLLLIASAVVGQTGHVGRWVGPCTQADVENMPLPNTACTLTVPQVANYATGGPCFAPTFFPLGGHALDQLHDLVYTCDGFTVSVDSYPTQLGYAANPCVGPTPGTSFAAPTPVMSSGVAFGPVTGMCVVLSSWAGTTIFPCEDVIFVTDGLNVLGFNPRPPNNVVVGPWAATGLNPGQILTGLEYDDLSGNLWACDSAGNTFQYSVFGALQSSFFINLPLLIVGNVLDRSSCPRQVWVTDGNLLWPVFGGPPILLNPGLGSMAFGASFSAEPVVMRGTCGSNCYPTPIIGSTEPVASGATATKSIAFTLSGAPPNTFALLAFDFACTGPLFLPPTCLWWMTTGGWFYSYTGITSATGTAQTAALAMPAASCPGLVGLVGYAQWFYFDTCAIGGFGVSDALHCRYSSL
jgi:hypothetical protein